MVIVCSTAISILIHFSYQFRRLLNRILCKTMEIVSQRMLKGKLRHSPFSFTPSQNSCNLLLSFILPKATDPGLIFSCGISTSILQSVFLFVIGQANLLSPPFTQIYFLMTDGYYCHKKAVTWQTVSQPAKFSYQFNL